MKRRNSIFGIIGITLWSLYVIYAQLMVNIVGYKIQLLCLVVSGIFLLYAGIVRRGMIFKLYRGIVVWLLIWLISVFHNANLFQYINSSLLMLFAIYVCIICSNQVEFVSRFYRSTKMLTIVSVFYAIVVYFFPTMYQPIYRLYGRVFGTNGGVLGYRSGLVYGNAVQGIVCGVSCIMVGCSIILCWKRNEKENRKGYLQFILFMIGLLLSTKRGPLIFVVMTLLVVYVVVNRKQVLRKGMKMLVGIVVTVGIVFFFSDQTLFADIISRFTQQEDFGSGRIQLWDAAWKSFIKHPLLGIGWLGYRENVSIGLYLVVLGNIESMDVHNVYLQVLCETGIIGFGIYMLAVMYTFFITYRLILDEEYLEYSREKKLAIISSFAIQLFYILYSLTGNCLYDLTFYFYMCSCAVAYAYNAVRKLNRNSLVSLV